MSQSVAKPLPASALFVHENENQQKDENEITHNPFAALPAGYFRRKKNK